MRLKEILNEVAQKNFVQQNYAAAKAVGDQLGVDPKVILGHWALETGWGKSVIPGTNNLGNIKDFSGGGVRAYDKVEKSNDAYRAYKDSGEFATDYANLLSKRYPGVMGTGSDAGAFVQGLQGGKYKYATGGQFDKTMLQMPGSVERYMDPAAIASIQPATRTTPVANTAVAAPVSKNVAATTQPSSTSAISQKISNLFNFNKSDDDQEVEIEINGTKRKFPNMKQAMAALAASKQKRQA